MAAVSAVSLRLLAGAVPKRLFAGLQRTIAASPSEYPWRVVNKVVLAEAVDEQQVVEQALRAQRDWIQRGGREKAARSVSVRAKGLVAKLLAQFIFVAIYSVVMVVGLLAIKHGWPGADIYRLLEWLYGVFPALTAH